MPCVVEKFVFLTLTKRISVTAFSDKKDQKFPVSSL